MKFALNHCTKLLAVLLALSFAGSAFGQNIVEGVDWARPGVDWSQYDKFLIKPLDISDVKVLKPAWAADDPDEWALEAVSGQAIQDMFMEELTAAISGDHGFDIVAAAGPGVLQLEVEFLSLTPYMKPGSASGDEGFEISTLGSGDVVVSAEIRDSETGSLLWLVEGERQIGTEYKELSQENHLANLRATFHTWGSRLRELLTVAHNRAGQ